MLAEALTRLQLQSLGTHDQASIRLRALSAQSGTLAMLLPDRGKDGPGTEPGARLLVCGCQSALKDAEALLRAWKAHASRASAGSPA